MDLLADCVAVFFIAHFLWSYYWNCYRKGYTIDLWHFELAFNVFAIYIMLPFSRIDLNALVIGPGLWRHTAPFVNEAYFISALGYAGILAGGNLWRLRLGLGLRRGFDRVIEWPLQGALNVLRAPRLVFVHCAISLALLGTTLAIYFAHSGFGFNLRGLLLVMPALRPLAQFAAFYGIMAGSYALARYAIYRERSMLVPPLMIAVAFCFYAERSDIIGVFMLALIVSMVRMRRRLRLVYLAAGVVGILFVAMLLDALRRPNFSPVAVLQRFGFNVFFGNSFSDTRDFATVLSFWNGQLLLGKTYLAGLISFVPRVLSPFRDKWALGVVTATMVGFLPTQHPGLRIGVFGEAFLNFGLPGVLALSLFLGSVLKLMDLRVKQSLAQLPRSGMRVFAYFILGYLTGAAQNSSSASAFYTVMVFIGVSAAMIKFSRFLKLPLA